MADINVEKRGSRPTMTWGWIGLGILLLAALAWLIWSFAAMGAGPDPPPVDFERVSPGQTTPAAGAPGTTGPGGTAPGTPMPGTAAPGTTAPGTTTPQGQTGP